jgi:hypothetical protein
MTTGQRGRPACGRKGTIQGPFVIIKTICRGLSVNEETATDKLLAAISCANATSRADVRVMFMYGFFIKKSMN